MTMRSLLLLQVTQAGTVTGSALLNELKLP